MTTKLKASHASLEAVQREVLTNNSRETFYLECDFSSEWDGLTIVATYRGSGESIPVEYPDDKKIPWECLQEVGETVKVAFTGSDGNGVTLSTTWTSIGKVEPSPTGIGDVTKEPTKTALETLVQVRLEAVQAGLTLADLLEQASTEEKSATALIEELKSTSESFSKEVSETVTTAKEEISKAVSDGEASISETVEAAKAEINSTSETAKTEMSEASEAAVEKVSKSVAEVETAKANLDESIASANAAKN